MCVGCTGAGGRGVCVRHVYVSLVWGRVVDSSVGSSSELISFKYAFRLVFRLLVYSIDYRI